VQGRKETQRKEKEREKTGTRNKEHAQIIIRDRVRIMTPKGQREG